jgi:hypothetical protein
MARTILEWENMHIEAYQLLDSRKECCIENNQWLVIESALTVAYI